MLHQRSLCAAPSQSLWPRQRQLQPVTAANRKTSLLQPTWDARRYRTCSPHARCHTQTIKLSFVGLGLRPSSLKYVRLRLKCDGTRAETRFYLRRNERVHLNWQGCLFSRLLAAEVCASVVVMLDTSCSEVVGMVLATHSSSLSSSCS